MSDGRGEMDERIIAELEFAIEQVENFVEHDISPPPSSWAPARPSTGPSGRVWRSFVLVQSTVDFLCPRRVPFPRLFWDAIPDPTGLMFTGSPAEVDDLVRWLEREREGEPDEILVAELDFAIEQVGYFVEHNIAPPPSSWGDVGPSFF